MRNTLLLFVIMLFWFLPPAQAEIKTFVHTVRQPFSGSQSPDDARVAATHKAKREVLEKAGTYLETLTIVEKGKLTKDQILALASGILETEIISQEPYTTKEGFGIVIKARVNVDTSMLSNRVKKLMADRTAMEQLTSFRKREKELLDKIESLEEQQLLVKIERLKEKHTASDKTKTTQIREKEIKKGFRNVTKGLNATTLFEQALGLGNTGKHFKAIEVLNKAIELDPGYVDAYNNRGIAYANLNQHIKAIQDYDKAIELDPGYAKAYNNRGVAYADLNQHIKAIQDYDKAIELDPGDAKAYDNRGNAYTNLNQHIKAIQDYDKAIELGHAKAYNNRGIAYMLLRLHDKGCADLKKACGLGHCNGLEIAIKLGDCL